MHNLQSFFLRFPEILVNNIFVDLLFVSICADMLFGTLRAVRYRSWNSAVGIDGAIRKAGMVASVLLFTMTDMLLHLDLLSCVPADVRTLTEALGLTKMGVTEFFCLLYVLYEATSVLKNMLLCGIPIPTGLREKLTEWLDTMTDEIQADLTGDK